MFALEGSIMSYEHMEPYIYNQQTQNMDVIPVLGLTIINNLQIGQHTYMYIFAKSMIAS